MVVVHSVFEITTFKMEKPLFLMAIRKIPVLLTFWSYNPMVDNQSSVALRNGCVLDFQHLYRVHSGPARTGHRVISRGIATDGSSHPAAERTSTTARDGGDDTREQGTPGQRVRAGVVDTRVIGKPDQFDGDPDWSFKLRSYLGVVDQRCQQDIVDTDRGEAKR